MRHTSVEIFSSSALCVCLPSPFFHITLIHTHMHTNTLIHSKDNPKWHRINRQFSYCYLPFFPKKINWKIFNSFRVRASSGWGDKNRQPQKLRTEKVEPLSREDTCTGKRIVEEIENKYWERDCVPSEWVHHWQRFRIGKQSVARNSDLTWKILSQRHRNKILLLSCSDEKSKSKEKRYLKATLKSFDSQTFLTLLLSCVGSNPRVTYDAWVFIRVLKFNGF